MSLPQLMDHFLEFERQERLVRWEAGGVAVWPYLRQRVFDEWSRERGVHAERQAVPVRRYLQHALAERGRLGRVLERYDVRRLTRAPILFLSHSRHYALGEQHVSPYTHFLLQDLAEENYWDLQFSSGGHHYVDDGLRRVVYLDALHQAAFKSYALARRWGRFRRLLRESARELGELLGRGLGHRLADSSLDRWIWNAVRTQQGFGAICERLLDRVQPRLIVNVVHYSWPNLTMTERAHRRGIRVSELQHGTVSPEHVAYNVGGDERSRALPDHFLSFGEFWSEMVGGLRLAPGHTPPIGFAWLEQRMAVAPRVSAKTLLVLSQRSIGVELSRLAVEAAKLLEPHGWRVIYRLHSGEVADHRERLPWLGGAPLEISTGSPDLYTALGAAGAQLGVYSTALFEGVAFALPTLIARLPGSGAMARLVEYGGARFVDGAREVVEALRQSESAGPPAELAQRVWQPGAVHNFRRFVERQLAETGSQRPRAVA